MKKFFNFIKEKEKIIGPALMFFGFIVDNFTIRRPDLFLENLLISFYLILSGIIIFLVNKYPKSSYETYLNFVLFFSFGGLFSVFTVFYMRSGTFWTSWPFLLILFGSMIGTEFLKKQYQIFLVQISIYFLAFYSFLIIHIPTVTGYMNVWSFIASGMAALLIIILYIFLIKKFIKFNIFKKSIYISVFTIFFVINIFYSLNIIPPVPLILRDVEVAQKIERVNNDYIIVDNNPDRKKYLWIIPGKEFVDFADGGHKNTIYLYTPIFAPVKITTEIIHEWQFFDEQKSEWVTFADIPMIIIGGRDGGYRAYSYVKTHLKGDFRVIIKTKNNQILKVHNFDVV